MALKSEYDLQADAAYVYLRSRRNVAYASTERLDGSRFMDLGADGEPIGIDFMDVSRGVDLTGIPRMEEVAEALRRHGLRVLLPAG